MSNTTQEKQRTRKDFDEPTPFSTKTLHEFMQPVEDTDTGTLTFTCCLCKKQYVAEKGEDVSFYFDERVVPGVNSSGGLICPHCEKEHL